MKITYTGVSPELLPKEKTKLEGKLVKLGKVIERKGEKEVHVFLSQVRHLHRAEITLNAFDHSMVSESSNGDLALAMSEAIEKLEKQVLKVRTKWRESHRHQPNKEKLASAENGVSAPPAAPKKTPKAAKSAGKAAPAPAAKAAKPAKTKVFRVDHQDGRKPMTLEEAMLEIGSSQDYLVYRDAQTDKVCTLLRRSDGHLDLIES
jgi:putative sigma-54 modulation protein